MGDWKTTASGVIGAIAMWATNLWPDLKWLFEGIAGLAIGAMGWYAQDSIRRARAAAEAGDAKK